MSQTKFSNNAIIFTVVGLIIIAGVGYYVFNARTSIINPDPVATPLANNSGPISNPSTNTNDGTVGMLTVVKDCMIPEGCGPKYKLWDSALKSWTPLLGRFKDKDSELIVSVVGNKTTLPSSEYGDMNYPGPTEAIEVTSYSVLSKIPYHEFLVDKGGEYTLKKYPCLAYKQYGRTFTKYNKTYSWELTNNTPIIKVKMADTASGVKSEAFYELWYNANSGSFIKEANSPKDKVFCP